MFFIVLRAQDNNGPGCFSSREGNSLPEQTQGNINAIDAILRLGVSQADIIGNEHIGTVVHCLGNNRVQIMFYDAAVLQQRLTGPVNGVGPFHAVFINTDLGRIQDFHDPSVPFTHN